MKEWLHHQQNKRDLLHSFIIIFDLVFYNQGIKGQ